MAEPCLCGAGASRASIPDGRFWGSFGLFDARSLPSCADSKMGLAQNSELDGDRSLQVVPSRSRLPSCWHVASGQAPGRGVAVGGSFSCWCRLGAELEGRVAHLLGSGVEDEGEAGLGEDVDSEVAAVFGP